MVKKRKAYWLKIMNLNLTQLPINPITNYLNFDTQKVFYVKYS